MGCRKKMWLCLSLWYALVYAESIRGKHLDEHSKFSNTVLPLAHNSTNKLSKLNRESENNYVGLTAATGLSNGETEHFHNFNKLNKSMVPIVVPDEDESKSRIGYEKDLMLVMPVNSNTNGSDLQMWYTQSPVTAIIEDHSTSMLEHRADYDAYEDQKTNDDRHPYTNFLINKSSKKPQKSPLDYGYPESFKFVEDLNGLPSNHKPEWASTDVIDLEEASTKTRVTTESVPSTKNNPFEMFESVKPLEINKLLSLQQMLQTASSESEEYTTEKKNNSDSHIHTVPKRPSKWPTKKPQKTKLTTEATTIESEPQINTTAQNFPMDSEQLYTAVRYTTLLSQSTKEFLPTSHPHKNKPIVGSSSHHFESISTTTSTTTPKTITTTTTEAITSPRTARTTTTTTTTTSTYRRPTTTTTTEAITTTKRPVTTTTTTTTTITPPPTTTSTTTPNSIGDIVVYNVTEDVDDEDPLPVDSLDSTASQNISDSPLENFQPPEGLNFFNLNSKPNEFKPLTEGSPALSGDMLTNDMKNMLIALGILKTEENKPTSSTEKEPMTPNIDANSYNSFKKIPTNYKQQPDKASISDDMKDLLASFGLLPNRQAQNASTSTRISRQQNLTEVNSTNPEIQTDLPINFTEEIGTETVTNFPDVSRANSSKITPEIEADVADFFNSENPSEVEKPINVNSEMLTDEMKDTLENLGLLKQSSLTNRSPKSAHVFQPTSQLEKLNKDDNVKKITDVLRTIKKLSIRTETNDISAEELEKQLQNLTATLDNEQFTDVNETLNENLLFELNEILNNDTNLKIIESIENMTKKMELNKTSTTTETIAIPDNIPITSQTQPIMQPPNPLSTGELLQLYEMGKNEIKRQQSNSTSTTTTSEQPPSTFPSAIDDASIPGTNTETFISNTEVPSINIETSSAPTTSTSLPTSSEIATDTKVEANNNAPVADLADSFGGAEVASDEPSADDLPTPKPNGLYFYLDWNTFLNVGEEDKNPVRIRFAPRAGNARNFLPITVP